MKMNDIKKIKKMMGVTMVALVITIIIMIILASIVLTMAIGDDGILKRAKNATDLYKQAQENEQIQLNNLYSELASVTSSGINVEEMNTLVKQIVREEILNMYPVGSIYISESEKDPSEFIGGKWERYGQGRTLVGLDENDNTFKTASSVGGEKAHTLTVEEMPTHNHINKNIWYSSTQPNSAWHQTPSTYNGYWAFNFQNNPYEYLHTGYGYIIPLNNGITDNNGNSKEHNNLQPYIVTYMWKRIE